MKTWKKSVEGKTIVYDSNKSRLEIFHNSKGTWSVIQFMKGGYDERFLGEFDNRIKALKFVKKFIEGKK